MLLAHVARYVTNNDKTLNENKLVGYTKFYFAKYGKFTQDLDRGGLKVVPTD